MSQNGGSRLRRTILAVGLAVLFGALSFALVAAQAEQTPPAGRDAAPHSVAPADPASGSAAPAGSSSASSAASSSGPGAARYTQVRGLGDWFRRGGAFMYPLALCSIVGLAVIVERFLALRRASTNTRVLVRSVLLALRTGGIPEAIAACERSRGPVARVLHSGLAKARLGLVPVERAIEAAGSIEVAFLQRGLLWLATVANLAPLLGFLGTVSGMIHAFANIAAADQISARLVASGIEEALITTEAGLCIAIPVQAFHNYFVGRIDRFITEMEEGALDLVTALDEGAREGEAPRAAEPQRSGGGEGAGG